MPGIARGLSYQVTPSQICALEPKITVRAEPHPTKKTEFEDEFEFEDDWGTRRSEEGRGRSQRAFFLSREFVRV
jgi:hypothetical protein